MTNLSSTNCKLCNALFDKQKKINKTNNGRGELCFGERKTLISCYGEWRTDLNLVGERRERSYRESEKEQKKNWKVNLKTSKPEISLCFRELFIKLLL